MASVTPLDGVVLETDRLVLRHLTMDDTDALAALYADPEVRAFFPDGVLMREETAEEIAWMIDVDYARYGYGLWATVLKTDGTVIGRCGLLPWAVVPSGRATLGLTGPSEHPAPDERVEVEVAYLLSRAHRRNGLATEAARAIVDWGFTNLPVRRLIALIDPENVASSGVATNAGLRPEGTVEEDGEVFPLFTIDRARWIQGLRRPDDRR
jgi:ribosomal-protein-alanine N-acetyltransferase